MTKFELNLRERNISKEKLIDDLKNVASLVNQDTVTAVLYAQKGKFGVNTFLRRFGSWNKALAASGLKVILTLNNKEEILFENLSNVWQQLGRQPTGKDLDKAKTTGCSKFSLGTYEKRFGSWNKALQSFINYINGSLENNEELIDDPQIKQDTNKLHRTPRKINWRLRATVLIRDNCICKMCGASPAVGPICCAPCRSCQTVVKGGRDRLRQSTHTLFCM